MNQVVVKEQAPLDELMLAMDVVDTLRHRELVLERELQSEDRDQRLLERLREIYTAQGIVVSDEVLAQGVRALREDRFVYAGPQPGVARSLATLYASRGRWGKWVGGVTAVIVVALLAFQFLVRGPELRAIEELPADLQGAYQGVTIATQDQTALAEAGQLLNAGEAAVAQRDYDAARAAVADLDALSDRLQQQYELRVVSRPGELSGVYRIPDVNSGARNYYLIVEAISPEGAALELPVLSEEGGRTRPVTKWGLRVDEDTFNRVAADKLDDGIIQQAVVGAKRRGDLDPRYAVATTGAAITTW
jgi:Family of unknown function (DUF6384)